ncbi:MAG: bifunctional 5,10-methylenetetrahydrofolate dehydrogenase/5,10-methenyltetrahydrofolate cyclohydrolase [Candidatus Levybacteria bacterium]|nr:bifunctional 5,10-methylenetetrahydrofolate dehydrogenase/5,10-methenyltetrahydrofolate cyclohydrolase [Candidatus Levybacteria bacterium]MDZ4228129.1 bifunctional 5,10-methylenetetrahydrofolate dehydrogenase/5,10-methenyltetrahydrofolate cyclohydrolase [Candidatus Levybacteria bacterium]
MRIDGKEIADKIITNLKKRVGELEKKNITPSVAIIIAGNDPASLAYIRLKEIKAKEIGIKPVIKRFPENISQDSLLKAVQQLNNDRNIHGIIVQQPLPSHIEASRVIQTIDPRKDVDGFLPNSDFEVPISSAVLETLKNVYGKPDFDFWLKSQKIIIVGKGETGGKPTINLLKKLEINFDVIDSKTEKPEDITKNADIIIVAVGKPNIITPEMIKKGVILIGIGISRGSEGKLEGDYKEEKIKDIASFYTPTPGGIGPINIAMLLKNVVTAAEKLT